MKTKLQVVKIGGELIDNTDQLDAFLKTFSKLSDPKILVHGGGKLATQLSEQLQIPVKMVDGRRITNAENLQIVTMVYAGLINKNLVAKLSALGCNSVGLTGADGQSIDAHQRKHEDIDYGFVGDIDSVNSDFIQGLIQEGITPVFSAISHDGKGQLLNTNADTIAAEIAIAMSSQFDVSLYYCFNKSGVVQDLNDDSSLIQNINQKSFHQLKADGIVHDGILPKLENSFHALQNQVSEVKIGNTTMLNSDSKNHTTIQL